MKSQWLGRMALCCTVLGIAGCGARQALFAPQPIALSMALVSLPALNPNAAGQSLSTVVRVYQLTTPQAFEQLSYAQLQSNDREILNGDVLATQDIVLRPDTRVNLEAPMAAGTHYVGVVAFFRRTGKPATWKLVVPKKRWKKHEMVRIEVKDNTLRLIPAP